MNATELREYMKELFDKDASFFYALWERLAEVERDNNDRGSYLIQEYGKDKIIAAMLGEGLLIVSNP